MESQTLIDDYTEGKGIRYPVSPSRQFRILIADNISSALRMTRRYFEDEKFITIPLSSPQAARLIINSSIHTLDAIVLDGRLSRDEDNKDCSGYQLAKETLERFVNPPPIVIYSSFDDRVSVKMDWDKVTFVLKNEGREALVKKVRNLIDSRMARAPREGYRPGFWVLPAIILDNQQGATEPLRQELTKYGVHAQPCTSLPALLEAAPYIPSAIFIIDLDLCKLDDGLSAIRHLKKIKDESGNSFFVAVLASREEFMDEETETSADFFLIKDSVEMDAHELIMRVAQHKIELEHGVAQRSLKENARRTYEELLRQLSEVRESPERSMTAPLKTVDRVLDWPFLMPEEQLILTSLYTQMSAIGDDEADIKTIDLCIEGASMLARDRAQTGDVNEWVERATEHSPDFTLAWFKEGELEDVFEDDEEESED